MAVEDLPFVIDPSWKKVATDRQVVYIDALNSERSFSGAARSLGISRQRLQRAIQAVERKARRAGQGVPPHPRRVSRFLLTAAQDETPVHAGFWENLHAYAAAIDAEVMVAGFTYQKGLFEDHATRTAAFVEEVGPYLQHENVDLGPVLFAAKMNILPTAVRPLSGLETYSRGRWAVFPHAKIQVVSIPALAGQHTAMQMTTGACTVANYIEKKAGLKAEFHHVIGATIVEIDEGGLIFCRQINATDDGSFQDLDTKVSAGQVTRGHRVEAITWGDIHRDMIDPDVALCAWGLDVTKDEIVTESSMFRDLRPRYQFFHDLLNFGRRNHHNRKDPHHRAKMLALGTESVEGEIIQSARFIRLTEADWCVSVVIPSNHNDAYPRWLRETSPADDPLNARFWCESNAAIYSAIERGDDRFDVFRWALARADAKRMDGIVFPTRNSSYVICQDSGGIECNLHGDQGPNGARGSTMAFLKAAMRINKAHNHTGEVLDGVYSAGLCGLMDQGYNEGLSSWSHTQIITYPSGKRSLVTIRDGRYRA